jgi:hypothetical protein
MGNYPKPSKIKQKLKKAHDELLSVGFLSQIESPANDRVRYVLSAAFLSERRVLELSGSEEEFAAIRLLASRGLRGDVARDLVAKHGPAHCTHYANALPLQKNLRNPAGWLRRAIEEGFELPEPLPLNPQSASPERSLFNDTAAEMQPRPPLSPDPAAEELWEQVLQDAEGDIDVSSLRVWFDGITPVGLQEDVLSIAVPNSFAKEYIESRFGELIESLIRKRLSNEKASLLVVVGSANQ